MSTLTSVLSSTQNSMKTYLGLSYHRVRACCLKRLEVGLGRGGQDFEGNTERWREETIWSYGVLLETRWRGAVGVGDSGENKPGKTRELRSSEVYSDHTTPLTHSHRDLGVWGSDGQNSAASNKR